MDKYLRVPPEIYAFQFNGDLDGEDVTDFLSEKPYDFYSEEHTLVLGNDIGIHYEIHEGDWIVLEGINHWLVVSDEEFQAGFILSPDQPTPPAERPSDDPPLDLNAEGLPTEPAPVDPQPETEVPATPAPDYS